MIRLSLRLEQPVVAAAPGADPNQVGTLSYLPGSALRGALIHRYLRHHNLETPPDWFFDGSVRVLNAYPHLHAGFNKGRALPTPLSFQAAKGHPDRLRDFALDPPTKDDVTTYKSDPAPFALIPHEGGVFYPATPDARAIVHTRRNRALGRSTTDDGDVYRYEALAPGQAFEAYVLCDAAERSQELLDFLASTPYFTLGKARSVEYGRVAVDKVTALSDAWVEGPYSTPEDPLVVTFLSDTLLRDAYGRWAADADAVTDALSAALGVALPPPKGAFLRTRLVGGFNRTWNLPLAQATALAMGSTLAYERPRDWDEPAAQRLLRTGLGERRTDGFGRIHIGPVTNDPYYEREDVPTTKPERVAVPTGAATTQAQRIAQGLLRRRLEQQLHERANHYAEVIQRKVGEALSRSQIGRFRNLVQNLLHGAVDGPAARTAALGRIEEYLKSAEARATTQAQFMQSGPASADGTLAGWVREVAREAVHGSPAQAGFGFDRVEDVTVGTNVQVGVSDALRFEYGLRLLHDAFLLAAKASAA